MSQLQRRLKFRHDNYLDAIHQAIQRAQENLCGFCDGLHAGHLRAGHARHCELELRHKIGVVQQEIVRVDEATEARRETRAGSKLKLRN